MAASSLNLKAGAVVKSDTVVLSHNVALHLGAVALVSSVYIVARAAGKKLCGALRGSRLSGLLREAASAVGAGGSTAEAAVGGDVAEALVKERVQVALGRAALAAQKSRVADLGRA
jgi:outer membrane lipoprotein SlyB